MPASELSRIPDEPLPTIETDSYTRVTLSDIADDAAIYANPEAPELSVVIADDKDDDQGGIAVFDLRGKLLQFRQEGKIGNVDLRAGFPFRGANIVLVGANNRTNGTIQFWQLNEAHQSLSDPIGEAATSNTPNYGFCLYHSHTSGKFYAFVTQETGSSVLEQYELSEIDSQVRVTLVRSLEIGSITEGCVADDALGRLYVAQEDVALWRYGAEPTDGSERTAVATVGDGNVNADLEGVGLALGPGTSGYLVVSVQSEDRFVTYDRETNAYLGGFRVDGNGDIDSVSQTDGLDICTGNLGPDFPKGALVVHDGDNPDGETSNLKFVPLQ